MRLKIGGLFEGYSGLTRGIQMVWPESDLVWYSEIDPGALRILAKHYADVPNLGDVTRIDWHNVEPVDVMSGGFPCQDLSDAGKKAGLRDGTRSGLWTEFARGIDIIRPKLVVIENVRGILNADAHSDLDCESCLAVAKGQPPLRACGAVLGDLADIGYDAAWHGLRAAEVGAPHGRWREFFLAWPSADTENLGSEWLGAPWGGWTGPADGGARTLMPTPRASDGPKGSPNQHGSSGDLMLPSAIHALLPTPSVAGGGKHIPEDAEWSGKAAYKPGGGKKVQVHIDQIHKLLPTPMANEGRKADTTQGAEDREGHQVYLTNVVCDLSAPTEARLLPTPTTKSCGYNSDGDWSLNAVDKLLPTPTRRDHKDHKVERAKHRPEAADNLSRALADRLNEEKWGEYAVAIALWESLHAPVPEPTEPGPSGPRLSPAFSEWMMGLPAGFITDPDIWVGWGRNKKGVDRSPRNAQLQAIGNGVVPQQAAAGIRVCLQIALMPVESAWEGKVQQKRWGSLLKREMRRK